MTTAAFKAWMKTMGYRHADAADALGISVDQVKSISAGRRVASRTIALACTALFHRHTPWNRETVSEA